MFWRKIGTTPLEVFFVFFAALYYGKINLSARAKAFTTVKFTKKICKCFSVSMPESAKAFTKPIQHLQNFVNALAFPSQKTLKHLQNFVSAVLVL